MVTDTSYPTSTLETIAVGSSSHNSRTVESSRGGNVVHEDAQELRKLATSLRQELAAVRAELAARRLQVQELIEHVRTQVVPRPDSA